MKKTIIILIAVLIAVAAILAILGRGGEYDAERLLYRTMKMAGKITGNPDVAPPKLLAAIERGMEKVIKKYPATIAAKSAHMKLVEFYIFIKEYDKALSATDTIIKRYGDDPVAMSMTYFFRGSIHEKQNRWDRAIKEFEILKDKYANTQLGMDAPIYIAHHYRQKGDSAETAKAYDDAAQFYRRMSNNNKGKMLGYAALSMLFQTYMETENYEKAGDVLADILDEYASPVAYTKFLRYVEPLFVKKLNNPAKAIGVYINIQMKTKDEKLKELLSKRIEALKNPKKD